MTEKQEQAIKAVEERIACEKQYSPAWCCAQDIIEMCRNEEDSAELILKDMAVKEMGPAECEKKIRALADERHKANGGKAACVTAREAEKIIREFYGLRDPGTAHAALSGYQPKQESAAKQIDLDDFFA